MLHGELPHGLELERATEVFDEASTPAGLRRAHRVAPGLWGVLRVHEGEMALVWEGDGAVVELRAGDGVVIPPDTPHHVEPGPGARFAVEFHRPA